MPGETDVINTGLSHIGATAIVSLTDGSKSANEASKVYTEIRDRLLRSHDWNFATKRQKLAQSATAPAFEFDYAYPLPSDWIRTTSVHNNDAGHGTILYRMEIVNGQRCIVTSASECYLRYVYRVTDPNLMSPDFRAALEYTIADALAIPLASSNTLQEKMEDKARRALAAARSSDGMGQFPEQRPRGSWAGVRGGNRLSDYLNSD